MAKLNPLLILVGVLIVSFVFLSMASSQSYLPFESSNHYAAYENFEEEEGEKEEEMKENFEGEEEEDEMKENFEGDGEDEEEEMRENFESLIEEPRTVKYGPLRDSEIIDKFSQVKTNGMEGVNGCVSSGLTNAGGYICLTPELIQLLKTRGGNATGSKQ